MLRGVWCHVGYRVQLESRVVDGLAAEVSGVRPSSSSQVFGPTRMMLRDAKEVRFAQLVFSDMRKPVGARRWLC